MDVYKIGVSLTLRNGVSAGLRLLRHDLGGVMKALDKANASTKDFGRSMIVAGAASAAFGAGILDVYEKIIRAGAKVVSQQAAMAAVAVRPGQIAKNTSAAWNVATSTSNVSAGGAMHTETMLRSMLGRSAKARAALPAVERAKVALDTLLGGHEDNSLALALKAVDIVGGENKGKKISVTTLLGNLPYIEQAMLLTHGLVTGSQILRMTRQAGPAATVTSFRSLLANYTEAVMALGPAVGRGLFTSYMVANVGRAPAVAAHYLTKYGMVPHADMHKVHGSSTYLFNPRDMLGHAYEVKHGFLDWVQHVVIPKLHADGAKTYNQMLAALSGMFSASTAARLLAFIAHNGPQIGRFKHLFADGVKNGHPYQSVSTRNWGLATKNFETAWANLVTALGVPAVKSAVSALNAVTNSIHHFTLWLSKHPMIAKHIDQLLLALGAAFLAFGTILMGAGIVMLLGTGGTLAAIAFGIGIFAAAMAMMNWKTVSGWVADGIHAVGEAMTWLLTPLREIGKVLGIGKTHPGASAANVGLAALRRAGMGGKTGQDILPGRHGIRHYFDGNGGRRVHHGSAIGGYDTWGPGAPPSAHSSADNGLIPTVNIGNWGEGQRAIKHGLAASLNQNQSSTTGFNGRVSPYGTPAFTGP
ncbi:hypothetical protein AiwAL_16850 [Acidiphilium sp. AL]|uniref:hypothetical protein n=1 Tax=Acidiphilium sp. AL TaxID=2871704 RepID=UPI0021CB70A2|nr:hypothetical protein [Acidiphilium sp. AL]MCU4161749.1 hypothetical protein [Acidiphilium sp. AL]